MLHEQSQFSWFSFSVRMFGQDDDENWPLSDVAVRRLLDKRDFLLKDVMVDQIFLSHLIQFDCINELHKRDIELQTTPEAMTRRLLEILPRRSIHQYNCFVNTLRETKQKFIADELERDEGMLLQFKNDMYLIFDNPS